MWTGPDGQQDVPRYAGFERDVVNALYDDYFSRLAEPLCTFRMYDVFTSVMGEWRCHHKAPWVNGGIFASVMGEWRSGAPAEICRVAPLTGEIF